MPEFILITELIGNVAFAVSGAVISINKRFDIFGVLFCAVTTALGGGVLRDIMVANLPPVMFRKEIYFITAVCTGIVIFLIARRNPDHFREDAERADSIVNIFDALGLGIFTVVGINTAIAQGYQDNAFFSVFLGMTTGCGGGILRDVMVREVPFVFTKRVYAVASIAGGIVYYLLDVTLSIDQFAALICGVAVTTALRITAAVRRWSLPKAF